MGDIFEFNSFEYTQLFCGECDGTSFSVYLPFQIVCNHCDTLMEGINEYEKEIETSEEKD